jgi:hypothetical protein
MHCRSEGLFHQARPALISLLPFPITDSHSHPDNQTQPVLSISPSPIIKASSTTAQSITPPLSPQISTESYQGLPLSSNLFAQPIKTSSNRLAKSKSTSSTRFRPACLAASLATSKYQPIICTSSHTFTYFHIASWCKLAL